MSFFTDIADFFSGSNKTHDQLNSFVNEKFTFFLNNSNLLLNFVSDFEDYKNGSMQDGKSKCNECEDLYILTNDIFEKYFNKINIPYNIDVSEGTSKTNYKDKVLYFFDLKDLKKILNEENLEKSSSDNTQFNKKRLLCKIISLSFIKIYIIVKSIYQTFNIYNSLITNGISNVDKYETNLQQYPTQYPDPIQDPDPYQDTVPTQYPDPIQYPDPTQYPDPIQDPDPTQYPVPQDPLLQGPVPQDPLLQGPVPQDPLLQDPDPTQYPDPIQGPVPQDPVLHGPVPQDPVPQDPVLQGPVPQDPLLQGPVPQDPLLQGPVPQDPTQDPVPQDPVPQDPVLQGPVPQGPVPQDPVPQDPLLQDPTQDPVPQGPYERPDPRQENQRGGGETMFATIFDKLLGKKTETSPPSITTTNVDLDFNPSRDPNLREENNKLQKSDNIFYSIFVILFENSVSEPLDITNFNAKFLTKGLNNMTNETLAGKIPEIIKYIVDSSIFSDEFLGKSCLLFRDDNFKFMNLETSDNESKEATLFVNQVDEEHKSFNKIIETKRALLKTILNRDNREPLTTYSNTQPRQEFANYKFFKSIKSDLKTMIKNYFSSRVNLYNNIVKELFMFDKKTNSIIGLNSKLTYKYISELSKKTEIILLDLHLALFKTLNSILTNSVNEINVMKKSTSLPITEEEYLGGAKTKTHRKRSIKRSIKRNIKRSIKRKRNRTKTRKATNKSYK